MMIIRQGTQPDSPLVYTLGRAFRYINLFFAVMIALGAFAVGREEPSALLSFPLLLVIILVVTAAYQDRWVFDARQRQVVAQTGVAIFIRRISIGFDEIEQFSLTEFKRGAMAESSTEGGAGERKGARYIRFAIVTHDGTTRVIDVSRVRKGDIQRVKQAARTISAFCGVPLEDSVWDTVDDLSGGLGILRQRNRWDIR